MEPDHPTENAEAEQAAIWRKWAKKLRNAPTDENYAGAYDEINAFLRNHGDPARARATDGTICGATGSIFDFEKGIILSLAGHTGYKVLDVGCGDGRLALELARRGVTVKGIDISLVAVETAAAFASREKLDLSFATGSAFDLGEAGAAYDYVISSDMVEHLHPSQVPRHFDEVRKILKPGGAYIVTVPKWEPPERIDPMHLGNYHPHELAALLRAAGFAPLPAVEKLYALKHDLGAIFGAPKTTMARAMRLAARLPLLGSLAAKKVIRRWCGNLNFFYAEKPCA